MGATHMKAPVSPSLQIDTLGAQFGDASAELASVGSAAHAITLSAPNPLTNPLLGDGTNQYVYSNDPTGGPHLTVPATIAIPGCSADDATWLLPKVSVSYDLPAANMETNVTYLASAGQIIAQTTYNFLISGSQVTSGLVYTGLPSTNDAFGNHVAKLLVQGSTSEQAHIQTFFIATDSTWPISDSYTPNWYHYYNQVFTSTGVFSADPGPSTTTADTDSSGHRTSTIYIRNPVTGFRVFGLNSNVSPYVIFLGTIYMGGIHGYIEACVHEQGHKTAWLTPGIETTKPYVTANGQPGSFIDLLTTWKDAHHLQSVDGNGNPIYDTTGAYGYGPPDPGDIECIADIQALQPFLNCIVDWQSDWSNTGLQISKPYFYQNGLANFYWKFAPSLTNTVHIVPNGQTDADGYYHITSLADLAGIYPGTTVLTKLSQLGP